MSFERLSARLNSLIGIGRVVAGTALGGRGARRIQVRFSDAEVQDNTYHLNAYGVASRPKPGADVVVIFPAGNRSGGIIIATNDRRYQLEIAEGEVALHDDLGQKVHLTRNGLVLDGAGRPVVIQNAPLVTAATPEFRCTGKITAVGNIESAATLKAATDVTIGARSFNGHNHAENGTGGGVTGTPL